MKSKGIRLLILGLLAGLLIGGFIQLERSLAQSLMGLLDDEVRASIPCTLAYDDVEISLITLKGSAKRPRAICGNSVDFEFETITAEFSLSNIFSREVRLTKLALINGLSKGVSPKSNTFKFVDYLSAPIPPERDRPNRWKIKLENLLIKNSSFVEELGKNALVGSDISLQLSYNENNDAVLKPKVGALQYLIRDKNSPIPRAILPLGAATGNIIIGDNQSDFTPVAVSDNQSLSVLNFTADKTQNNSLSGTGSHTLSFQYLGLPDWISATIDGASVVSGYLESPILKGSLASTPNTTGNVKFGDIKIITLENITGEYKVDVNHGDPIVTVSSLSAQKDADAVTLTSPLVLDGDKLSGAFHVNIDTVNVSSAYFKGLSLDLTVKGILDDLTTDITGTVDELYSFPFKINDLSAKVSVHNDIIALNANKPDLDIHSTIDITPDGLKIREGKFEAKHAPASSLLEFIPKDSYTGAIEITGSGNASGPFDPAQIASKASFTLTKPSWDEGTTMSGTSKIEKGKAELSINAFDSKLTSQSIFILDNSGAQSKSTIDFKEFSFAPYKLEDDCSLVNASVQYNFSSDSPKEGSGSISVPTFSIGCQQYRVALKKDSVIPIAKGKIYLKDLSFESLQSGLKLGGEISFKDGYNASLAGDIPLETFSQFVPSFDDVRGFAKADLSVNGPFSEPKFGGSLFVNKGEIYIESAGLSLTDIFGKATFSENKISIDAFQGNANGGSLLVSGSIFPFDMKQSHILASFQDAGFEPTPELSIIASGGLALRTSETEAVRIEGNITVQNAEYQKELSIFSVAKKLADFLFAVRSTNKLNSLPSYGLNVAIEAKRNIFFLTDFAGVELKGNVHLGGSLNAPDITGTMESLTGWFGLHDRKFDITSGVLTFPGGLSLPNLALLGETSIRSKNADTVTLYLDAKGPLLDPKIELSSDSGMSQRELLSLLTTRSQRLESSYSTDILEREGKGYSLVQDIPLLSYSRFFRAITRLDSINIEPEYNYQSGAIEPVVTARKNLTDKLYLVGEGYLGTQSTESRAGIVYNFLPYLTPAAYIANTSDKRNLAVETNLTVTLLSSEKKYVTYTFEGNKEFDNDELLKASRLNTKSKIPTGEFKQVLNAIKRFYFAKGYFNVDVKGRCFNDGTHCKKIQFTINEGVPYQIEQLELTEEAIPEELAKKVKLDITDHSVASSEYLKGTEKSVIQALRSEGYISARVKASYEKIDDRSAKLQLRIAVGKPVSFNFYGNTVFTPEELLKSINLFGRKTPFGTNTINILVQNIEELYTQSGYLFSTVHFEELTDRDSLRTIYQIEISEERKADVKQVSFEGLEKISEEKLRKKLIKRDPQRAKEILAPRYAVPSEIEEEIIFITDTLQREGFTEATTKYVLETDENDSSVTIRYIISEGPLFREKRLHIEGVPENISFKKDEKVISALEVNEAIDALLSLMRTRGYVSASLVSTEEKEHEIICVLEAGEQTRIGHISLEGLSDVQKEVILRELRLKEGDIWDEEKISEAKQRILKLGLLSNVDIHTKDKGLDSSEEEMIVKVNEKPLQSLELGGGYNTEYGVHLFGEGIDRSLFSDGRALIMRTDAYVNSPSGETISKGLASMKYVDPTLFNDYVLTEDVRYQKFNSSTQEFDLDRTSLASYFYRAWENGWSFSSGHTIMNENITDVPGDVVLSELDSGNVFLGFLSGFTSYDKRDNPLNPREGYDLSADYKISSPAFGSEASFYSLGGKASGLYPFEIGTTQFTIAGYLRGGTAWTFANTSDIPISQRYYLGGRNSIRGYKENSLGPRGKDANTIGGDSLLAGTGEFQYHPTEETAVLLFLDAGNVFLKGFDEGTIGALADQVEEDNDLLRYSTGLGFRYLSPIGPIGLDVGFPINGRDTDSSYRIHFNIGTNF